MDDALKFVYLAFLWPIFKYAILFIIYNQFPLSILSSCPTTLCSELLEDGFKDLTVTLFIFRWNSV